MIDLKKLNQLNCKKIFHCSSNQPQNLFNPNPATPANTNTTTQMSTRRYDEWL